MILIVTNPADVHKDAVAAILRERGIPFQRFDPAAYPVEVSLTHRFGRDGSTGSELRSGGTRIDLGALTAVWFRRPGDPVPHAEITNPTTREQVVETCATALQGVWDCLTCLAVPAPPATLRRASLKLPQLRLAAELGFTVPPTLVTTDPDEFLAFWQEHAGKVITKSVTTAALRRDAGDGTERGLLRYTEVVTPRDLGYAAALRYCPVIAQAYVPKRIELRVTVVGDRVFAAAIGSQESRRTQHDWRRYDDLRTPHFPYELPDAVAERCARLVARLGLVYGAIDLIVTPDDDHVFIEINPNGQYLWIEHETGLPISEAIADLLERGGPSPSSAPIAPTVSGAAA